MYTYTHKTTNIYIYIYIYKYILKTLRESPPAPRVLTIVAELSRSAYLGSVMGQLLHTCWEKSRWRFFRHWLHCRFTRKMVEHILKTTSAKMCQKIMPKIVKNWENRGLEGVLGGLGAFLEPCRAGLAAEAQKCTPEVAKLAQLGGILEVKLGLKSQKNRF